MTQDEDNSRTISNKIQNANVIQNAFSLSRTNMDNAKSEVNDGLQEIYN